MLELESPRHDAAAENVDTKPVDTKPVDTKPVDTKPVDTKPIDARHAATSKVETCSAEDPPGASARVSISSNFDKCAAIQGARMRANFGDLSWLMSQSPNHKYHSLADLEWLILPALMLQQFKIYRNSQGQIWGAVLWARLSEACQLKYVATGHIAPEDWAAHDWAAHERAGREGATSPSFSQDNSTRVCTNAQNMDGAAPSSKTDDSNLWIIDLVAPFHTLDNLHRQTILNDVFQSRLKGEVAKILQPNKLTGQNEIAILNDE